MGASCGILDDSFDQLYDEAKSYFNNPIELNLNEFDFDDNLDEKIKELNKKRNKYLKIRTNDFKKQRKIAIVDSYLKIQIDRLQNSKQMKIFNENCQRIMENQQKAFWREELSLMALKDYYKSLTSHLLSICSNVKNLKAHNNDSNYIPPNNFGYISIETQNNKKTFDERWISAYHGTGRNCYNDDEIKDMIENISYNGFKNGRNNVHANCQDINHPLKKVGIGVYVTPNLEIAKQYAGIISFEGKKYYTIFLVKVKKSAIRRCNCPEATDYWVVNGSFDEIIPDKILYEFYE